MANVDAKIVALVGPTASGKSSVALALAKKTGASILSCDSLLVYKNLNIGTAKPTSSELKEIEHFGIDLVPLDSEFNAGDYVRYAQPILEKFHRENRSLLIVGGTGFYLKALLCGVWDTPPTQPLLRAALEASVKDLAPDEKNKKLHERLAQLDPEYAGKVKSGDTYRVLRALEIIETTKKPLSEILKTTKLTNALPFTVPVLGIRREKENLERRIIERTNEMFQAGLVNETKQLLGMHADKTPRALNCVGYNEVMRFLEGKLDIEQTRERTIISTRQLAKKQMTFFKTFPQEITWYDFPTQEDELIKQAQQILCGKP